MKNFLYVTGVVLSLVSTQVVAAATVPVSVDSDPQGAIFTLEIPNEKFVVTGKTPARVHDVPAGKAIIHFQTLDNCIAPKPQNRSLDSDKPMAFFGRYTCGNSTAEPTVTTQNPVVPAKRVSVRLSPHQLEYISGNTVRYTLAVHNEADAINGNITARFTFNPSELKVATMPAGARLISNNQIEWDIQTLAYNQTWSVPIDMMVLSTKNHSIVASATVHGAEVKQVQASATIGTPTLPKTGVGLDVLFILLSLGFIVPTVIATKKIA